MPIKSYNSILRVVSFIVAVCFFATTVGRDISYAYAKEASQPASSTLQPPIVSNNQNRVERLKKVLELSPMDYKEQFLSMGLSPEDVEYLAAYVYNFLQNPECGYLFQNNPVEILRSLSEAKYLSIPLRPAGSSLSTIHKYSMYHRTFINGMRDDIKNKLFKEKLLLDEREKNIMDFLKKMLVKQDSLLPSERDFFREIDLDSSLKEQGVVLSGVEDFSSGRAHDPGSIVIKITLERNGQRLTLFLKGLGKRHELLNSRDGRNPRYYESFAFAVMEMSGLPSIAATFYEDSMDSNIAGFTLMQEIRGQDTNELFDVSEKGFRIKQEYIRYKNILIEDFARFAAVSDLLNKGDRKIFQTLSMYPANYLVNFDGLEGGKSVVYAIDHLWLFNKDNSLLLKNLREEGSGEMGILLAFEGFYKSEEGRRGLISKYQAAYLNQWEKIIASKSEIANLVENTFGKDSREYEIFQQAAQKDPRDNLKEQENALMEFVELELAEAKRRLELDRQLIKNGRERVSPVVNPDGRDMTLYYPAAGADIAAALAVTDATTLVYTDLSRFHWHVNHIDCYRTIIEAIKLMGGTIESLEFIPKMNGAALDYIPHDKSQTGKLTVKFRLPSRDGTMRERVLIYYTGVDANRFVPEEIRRGYDILWTGCPHAFLSFFPDIHWELLALLREGGVTIFPCRSYTLWTETLLGVKISELYEKTLTSTGLKFNRALEFDIDDGHYEGIIVAVKDTAIREYSESEKRYREWLLQCAQERGIKIEELDKEVNSISLRSVSGGRLYEIIAERLNKIRCDAFDKRALGPVDLNGWQQAEKAVKGKL